MRPIIILAVVLLALARPQTVSALDSSMPMSSMSVVVSITAQSGSGQTGTATLTSTKDNKTQVVISLKGEPANAVEPAHIHPGTCAKLNPKPTDPLTSVANGTSTSIVNKPLASLESGAFSINVHQSADNIGTYVACGTIPKAAPAASAPMAPSAPSAMPSSMPSYKP